MFSLKGENSFILTTLDVKKLKTINMKWTKGMDMGFRVGQTVYAWGIESKVVKIENDACLYPVEIQFNDSSIDNFMIDGRYDEMHEAPSLFHTPQTYDIELPKYEPKEGEVCWAYTSDSEHPYLVEYCGKDVRDFKIRFYGNTQQTKYNSSTVIFKPFKGELP
jgi:hypothetical protein